MISIVNIWFNNDLNMMHFITSSLRFLFEGPHGNVLYTGTVIKNKVVMHGAVTHIHMQLPVIGILRMLKLQITDAHSYGTLAFTFVVQEILFNV